MAHRPDAEAPLLAKPDAAAATPPPPAKRNKYPFFCAALACMTSVLMGYNVGVLSGAQIFMAEDLGVSDAQIEVLSGIINIYSLVGALLGGWTSDRLGRRLTIVVANAFFLVGPLAMSVAGGYTLLMVGRFVAGVGVGYALVVAPVYAAEIAPASSRGLLTSLPEIFINCGVMLGYVSNLVFSGLPAHLSWRLMIGAGAVPTVFLAAGVLTMPESPRWLAMKGRVADAKAVLDRTSDTPAEARQRLLEIEDVVSSSGAGAGGGGTWWKEVATKAGVRRVLAVVLTLQFFQQASGIDSVVLYGPRILAMAGVTSNTLLLSLNVLFGVAKAGSILIAMALTDRVGRRPLLLVSTGGMTLALLVLGSIFVAFAGAEDDAAVRGQLRGHRGLRRHLLRRLRPAGVGVQLRGPAAAAASAGRRARHRYEPNHERRGHHDLLVALPGHHHGRRVLPLRRHRRRLVRVHLRLPTGDQGPEPRGHGGALPNQVSSSKIIG